MSKFIFSLVIFEVTFFGMLALIAVSVGGVATLNINAYIGLIFAKFPDPGSTPGQLTSCDFWNITCHTSNLTIATAWIAYTIGYGFSLAFSFLARLPAFGLLLWALISFPNNLGAPFVSNIIIGIQVIFAIFGFMLLRGNPSGE